MNPTSSAPRSLAACLLLGAAGGCALAPPSASNPMQPVLNALMQGDAVEASRLFERLDAPLTAKQQAAADCIRARFSEEMPARDLPPTATAILKAYEEYWRAAMLKADSRAVLEARLLESLNAIPAMAGATDHGSLDAVSDYAVIAIEAEGLHALTGKTEPFYELMIWKDQETKVYDVALPEGPINVTVVFLDKFASMGWTGFATCEAAHTGGWAKPDALFAVRSAYDVESETFRVSYLAHEGQHFADYRRYPALEQPELEYRAKLTEIATSSRTTSALIDKFDGLAGTSRTVPHAFANWQVSLALEGIPIERVREAAREKLLESTATLDRLGPASTKRFLPD
ncbi:MAG: hypothetical protein ACXWG9_05475 [Usitatibacter sp.]